MSSQENKYDNYVFQILEVNKELLENNDEEKGTKIVYGKLSKIREYYQQKYNYIYDVNGKLTEDKNKFFNDYLPSPGVKVETSFLGEEDQNTYLKYAEFATVRFLLQCRRLSQMMTKTWLNDPTFVSPEENNKIKYMNKIFHIFNYKPQETYAIKKDQSGKIEQIKTDLLGDIYKSLQEEQMFYACDSSHKNSDKEKEKENQQKSMSYYLHHDKALILELFLSGQAYIVDDRNPNPTLQRLNEPIFSTYELIWEYELDLSWDTYYAKREDIARPGYRQIIRQPNTRVTLGLPARPDYKLLTDDKIRRWVYAEERYGEKNAFSVDGKPEEGLSFYPEKGSEEWKNKQVKNVFPPYPYIILSCS